jgi:hypothetical protein
LASRLADEAIGDAVTAKAPDANKLDGVTFKAPSAELKGGPYKVRQRLRVAVKDKANYVQHLGLSDRISLPYCRVEIAQ